MGKILNELLEDMKKENIDNIHEQVMEFSKKIFEEEDCHMKYNDLHPDGPNHILTLETKGVLKKEIGFLTLERDIGDIYVVVHRTIFEPNIKHLKDIEPLPYRINKKWEIDENESMKIIKEFAKIYKYLEGK